MKLPDTISFDEAVVVESVAVACHALRRSRFDLIIKSTGIRCGTKLNYDGVHSMRIMIPINNEWYFKVHYEQGIENSASFQGFEKVNLPHTNVELPYNYFDEKMFQIVSCYKYPLTLSKEYRGKVLM